MINGVGVLGWGVGGIEAEAALLGQPVSMLIPQVIGFRLTGKLKEGATATDLVLTVTQALRKRGVVGAAARQGADVGQRARHARNGGGRCAWQYDKRLVGSDFVDRRREVGRRRAAQHARADRANPAAQSARQPGGQALLQRGDQLFLARGGVPPV
jgi:hypothetical protein